MTRNVLKVWLKAHRGSAMTAGCCFVWYRYYLRLRRQNDDILQTGKEYHMAKQCQLAVIHWFEFNARKTSHSIDLSEANQ